MCDEGVQRRRSQRGYLRVTAKWDGDDLQAGAKMGKKGNL